MSLYGLVRPLLFSLDPETAHRVTLSLLEKSFYSRKSPRLPVHAMGLEFPNPVGLAAGLDKNAEHIDALARLGFGFLEVGTVTPRPQPGNPRPRLFRVVEKEAIINRLGFNNVGIDACLRNVERARWKGILGINIGKNADTPAERAIEDYASCFDKAYAQASYVTINVSSPNTKNLRDLQQRNPLEKLLLTLAEQRKTLSQKHGKHVPLALKVAPDLEAQDIADIAAAVRRHRIEGVIATNTSLSRDGVEHLKNAAEAGGLSGAPLKARATEILRQFSVALKGEATLIGAGGICSREDAGEKFAAGATLVQLYTGLVYRGPDLVGECVP
ncbi:MAG TPA: quinone-dependent dihydroorotate dehydrogenase [Burkholderiales bacterium]